ncbi:MAG: hypothetical protein IJX76_01665, partial [Clostridia bacterium]|nr:hypothetical protein [Clostridia bacterium]
KGSWNSKNFYKSRQILAGQEVVMKISLPAKLHSNFAIRSLWEVWNPFYRKGSKKNHAIY